MTETPTTDKTSPRSFSVGNVIRYRATRDGIQREFDTHDQAKAWADASPVTE